MAWLNYHHLHYFWCVVQGGGLAGASRRLRLAESTISAQVRTLETALGEALFVRTGRRLRLTDTGQTVYRYASEIFALGQELQDTLAGAPTGRAVRAAIGVAQGVPEAVARRLAAPALALREPLQISFRTDRLDVLLHELASHALELVIADGPPEADPALAGHLLARSEVVVLGAPDLAARYRRGFPRSLAGAPLLLPAPTTALRRALDPWLAEHGVDARPVCEVEDPSLAAEFAESGAGLLFVPELVQGEVCRRRRLRAVGRAAGLAVTYHAVSMIRRVRNPVVEAITATLSPERTVAS